MDTMSAIWMAAQYLTSGHRHGVFLLGSLRVYARLQGAPALELEECLLKAEGVFWWSFGHHKMLTPCGSTQLWTRYGKPCPRNKSPERQNATARYFAHNFTRIYPYAQAYLSKKLPRSAELGKIEDHIMGWILLAIDRNYLAKYIERNVAPSLICHFIYNKACSDLRRDGRDPSCRALHGALAPHEVTARNNDQVSWTERVEPLMPLSGEDPLANIADQSSMGQPDQSTSDFDLEAVSSIIAELLDRQYVNIPLMQFYEAKYDLGLGIRATAEKLGLRPEQVQAGHKEVKRVLDGRKALFLRMGVQLTA